MQQNGTMLSSAILVAIKNEVRGIGACNSGNRLESGYWWLSGISGGSSVLC